MKLKYDNTTALEIYGENAVKVVFDGTLFNSFLLLIIWLTGLFRLCC